MKDYGGEQVLAIPVDYLKSEGIFFEGIRRSAGPWPSILTHAVFIDRMTAETDENYLQIIPYAVFVSGDRVLVYERGSTGGEKRLVGFKSIGVGGHINPRNTDEVDVVFEDGAQEGADIVTQYGMNLVREVSEELGPLAAVALVGEVIPTALVHYRSDAVGRVHLGFVHVTRTKVPLALNDMEDCLQNAEYVPVTSLVSDELEVWSKLALEAIAWEAKK